MPAMPPAAKCWMALIKVGHGRRFTGPAIVAPTTAVAGESVCRPMPDGQP